MFVSTKSINMIANRFRFGENRGRVGNGRLKKLMRKKRSPIFSCKRKLKKGLHTNALSDCLVDDISESDNKIYKVSFRNRPLIGKVFTGIEITRLSMVTQDSNVTKEIVEKRDAIYSHLQHISREIERLGEGEAADKYKEEYENQADKLNNRIFIGRKSKSYPVMKKRKIRLRVIDVVEYDDKFNSYVCIAEPT